MATLSAEDQLRVTRAFLRFLSARRENVSFNRVEAISATGNADSWVDGNAGAYNTALPAGFRTNAANPQKALLLAFLAIARYDMTLLQRIAGAYGGTE